MSLMLNKEFKIKSVSVSEDAKVVIISGYASFNQDLMGVKEVDRDGEIVSVAGIDLEDYLKNPIVLFNHEWDKPFGTITNIVKDQQGLLVTAEIHKLQSLDGEFEAVAKGILKAFSVGFQALEYRFLDNDIVEITKSRLLEVSIVSIPSNASSLFQVIGTKSLNMNKDALKYALEANSIKNITSSDSADVQKEKTLNIENKTTTQEPTPATEPAPTEATPVTTEPTATQVTEPAAQPATVVTTPVTQEPVVAPSVSVNLETLVNAMVEADLKAEAAKEAAKQEALKKEQETAAALVAAEQSRVQSALDYIKERKLAIESTPAGEIDIEELDSFYELLSDVVETIDGKVKEVVETIKATPVV